MDFLTWVIVVMVVMIIAAVFQSIGISNKQKSMETQLARIHNFRATQKVMGADGNTGLAIDEHRKSVCLINNRQKNVSLRFCSYKDLLSSEVFEDGITVTKTVRSSQVGGALLGGLVLGGVGAIIGGLSGKTQTSGKVKSIDLRLTINDTKGPLHNVNFLVSETEKNNSIYQSAIQQARHWHGLIEILIKRADMEDKANITDNTLKPDTRSIADEIKKLAELRDTGILSFDEFEQQKIKLLDLSNPV